MGSERGSDDLGHECADLVDKTSLSSRQMPDRSQQAYRRRAWLAYHRR